MVRSDGRSRSSTRVGSSNGDAHTHGHTPRPFHIYRPIAFLNPTRAHYALHTSDGGRIVSTDEKQDDGAAGLDQPFFKWRSRDNRKGRHMLVVPKGSGSGSC